jgi:hypothetical protein
VAQAEDGSITPLFAVVIGIAAFLMYTVATVGEQMVDELRARISADASALAGIYGGDDTAAIVAQENGGTIVETTDTRGDNGRFGATVTVGRHRATAWAVDTWAPATPTLEP